MINHARTLLLNRALPQNLDDLGEEIIPAAFQPFDVPSWMLPVRSVVLGARPENVYANFSVDRILRVVHATEYAGYLLQHDRRITYDPHSTNTFAADSPRISVRTLAVGNIVDVSRIGDLVADDVNGVMRQRWRILLADGVATATDVRTGDAVEQYIRVSDSALSSELPLPGSGLRVRLRMNSTQEEHWFGNIELTATLKSSRDLSDVVASLDAQRLDATRQLFGSGGDSRYSTFQRLWRVDNPLPYRVAGVVLALIQRSHELWSA